MYIFKYIIPYKRELFNSCNINNTAIKKLLSSLYFNQTREKKCYLKNKFDLTKTKNY